MTAADRTRTGISLGQMAFWSSCCEIFLKGSIRQIQTVEQSGLFLFVGTMHWQQQTVGMTEASVWRDIHVCQPVPAYLGLDWDWLTWLAGMGMRYVA